MLYFFPWGRGGVCEKILFLNFFNRDPPTPPPPPPLLIELYFWATKTRTLTFKKDPFFKNQGPVKYAQKHPYFRVFRTLMRIIKHGEWGGGGGGWPGIGERPYPKVLVLVSVKTIVSSIAQVTSVSSVSRMSWIWLE